METGEWQVTKTALWIEPRSFHCSNFQMRKLTVDPDSQSATLWLDGKQVRTYRISTARNGLSCENDSFCTPTGQFRVAQKLGHSLPPGAVLVARTPTGQIWPSDFQSETDSSAEDRDLVLTRVLWLEGVETHNKNTFDRFIYLHGTNHEDKLGSPASHGCIRFGNDDVIELFEFLTEGDSVEILAPLKAERG